MQPNAVTGEGRRSNATSESFGNGLWVQNEFDPLTGLAITRKAGTGGQETNIQHWSHQWDVAGNLTSRQDLRQSLTESFGYDALYRLTTRTGPGGSMSIAYDSIGNITSKTGISGTFTYDTTRKHAVTSAGSVSYSYDHNGNMTSRGGATITWSSYNLPTMINAPNGLLAQFSYTPDRARWRQISTYAGGSTETTIYVGGLLEKLIVDGVTRWKHLIPTPSGQVQVVRRSDGTQQTLYVVTDHLGSTDAALDATGSVAMRASFGVHGERRSSNWQGAPTTAEMEAIGNTTRHGYTGHEMLDNVNLVHMNGRVFDPAIGRFLSADPFIDGEYTTQGWNRYAYVHGRLMSATDPSGYDRCQPVCRSNGSDAGNITTVTVTAPRINRIPVRDPDINREMRNFLNYLSRPEIAVGAEGTITGAVIEEVVVEESAEGGEQPHKTPPCRMEEDRDTWSVTLGGYKGLGFEIQFGQDEGNSFVTYRVGFGRGAGISYTPYASIPGPELENRYQSGLVLSVSGQAKFAAGPLSTKLEYGAGRNYAEETSSFFGGPNFSFRNRTLGLGASASSAAQGTYYTKRLSYFASQGTCHL